MSRGWLAPVAAMLVLAGCGGGHEVHVTIKAADALTIDQLASVRTLEIAVLGSEPSGAVYTLGQQLADRKTTWIYKSKVDGPLLFQVTARTDGRLFVAGGKSDVVTPSGKSAVSTTVVISADTPAITKRRLGETCAAGVDACASGFCVDGVCCDSVCEGDCKTCNGNTPGHCGPAGVGTNPRKQCKADVQNLCGSDGMCDGAGACRIAPKGKICAQTACATGIQSNLATCDGAGTCGTPTTRNCSPFDCNPTGTACATICTSMAGCSTGFTCAAGSCGKGTQGARCFGGPTCQNGTCIDGYCCDTQCEGACKSCKAPGQEGTCVDVVEGDSDIHGLCTDAGVTTCGSNGKCDGMGGCARYRAGTLCSPGACSADGTMAMAPSVCVGDGSACPAPATTSCGPYRCVTDGAPGCDVSCGECAYHPADMGAPLFTSCAAGAACVDHCLLADSQFVCQ